MFRAVKSFWFLLVIVCLAAGCGRDEVTIEEVSLSVDGEAATAKVSEPVTPTKVTPPKPWHEQSREFVQKAIIGTWRADDGSEKVIAFDPQWRVSHFGKGKEAQEVDASIIDGLVTYEIIAPSDPPQLEIRHPEGSLHIFLPAGNEKIGDRYSILRAADGTVRLTEILAEGESAPLSFVQESNEVFSVIDDEENGEDY